MGRLTKPAHLPPGSGGLEIRGHGVGSAVPVGVPAGCGGRHGRHHLAGAVSLRRPPRARPKILGDRTASAEKVSSAAPPADK